MGKPRWKGEGNSKLGYGFKGAVASESTDLIARMLRTRKKRYGNIPRNAYQYDITVIKVVGRDETGVGNGRVPGFANAPESKERFHG